MTRSSPIRLTHYDPRWPQEFLQTRSGLLQCCGGRVTQIEHVGGTAMAGCVSQPVIDLIAGVDDETLLGEATLLIEGLYFQQVGPPPWEPRAVCLTKPRRGVPTHQVFVMPIGCPGWKTALRLRDHFRQNREAALRFEEAKVSVWKRHEADPESYRRDKRALLTHFIDQASLS